jgi:Holliday junction resolvase
MGKMQRTKGANAERELLSLLNDGLGLNLTRNLTQTREGGADCDDLDGFALEIKRHETLHLAQWWEQTLAQAAGKIPALAYRQSRKPWSFIVPMDCLNGDFPASTDLDFTVTLSLKGFILLVRMKK